MTHAEMVRFHISHIHEILYTPETRNTHVDYTVLVRTFCGLFESFGVLLVPSPKPKTVTENRIGLAVVVSSLVAVRRVRQREQIIEGGN